MYSHDQKEQQVITGIVPAWTDWIDWQDRQLEQLAKK